MSIKICYLCNANHVYTSALCSGTTKLCCPYKFDSLPYKNVMWIFKQLDHIIFDKLVVGIDKKNLEKKVHFWKYPCFFKFIFIILEFTGWKKQNLIVG